MVNPAIIGLAGLGAGAAIGYVVATTMGNGSSLPRIELSRYQVPIGQTYDLTCLNFPPNSQIVSPISLYPPNFANLGTTDNQGTLKLTGLTAQGPAADYYLIAWNATDGKYCAVATLKVT